MVSNVDIYRLVEENKEIIIRLFKQAGYDYMLVTDKAIIKIFSDCGGYVVSEIEHCVGKKGVLLCLEQNKYVLEAESKLKNIKVHVLSAEYNRMLNQLKLATKLAVDAYKVLFGYSTIIYDGQGECFETLKEITDKSAGDDSSTLYITEFIDNGCMYDFGRKNTLGIRQFLYELEVLATFPAEIENKLFDYEAFEKFAARFCDIFDDTDWDVVFSEKTPFTEKLIKKYGKGKVQYLKNYTQSKKNGRKVFVIENGNLVGVRIFYHLNRGKNWIVTRRFIVLFRTWIMEELCNYFRNVLAEKGVHLQLVNWNWAMNNPLFPSGIFTSIDIENREKYNLYDIRGNISVYGEFLKGVYGVDYSEEYVTEVMDIPSKIQMSSGLIRHENKKSNYINVVNGERYTEGQPEKSKNSIYMLGGCVFFGYAVEDAHTISSYLQENINRYIGEDEWKVVNMGTWGGNIDQTYKMIYDLKLRAGDIVLVSYAGYMPLGENYKLWDISAALNNAQIDEKAYFNSVIHCSNVGYRLVGKQIFSLLEKKLRSYRETDSGFYLEKIGSGEVQELNYNEQAKEYIAMVSREIPESWKTGTYGAIVMNCNPFTLGHRYLIEQSAKKVDYLYIFVVEEDKSFFPFEDRINLVKAGTKGITNLIVVPSGKLIISSVTFPGYFLKDSPDCVSVDTSLDVDVFARYIAKPLKITKRFVGEEPLDRVTRSYNDNMKEILPRYGIQVDEIPRKQEQGNVISASRVRKALKTGDFGSIRHLVPETTLNYLMERKEQYLEKKGK